MNIKTFCIWLWKSIFQGTLILMLGLFMFRDSFANIVMITFTSLIINEILKAPGDRDLARCRALTEAAFQSEDYIEGRRAFMEKRKPQFKGR